MTSFLVSSAAVATWLFLRHAPGAWAVQNMLALLVAILSCAQIKLPGMRSAAFLLTALFFYDLFMVFGTPLLVGESVMVEVATAGMPSAPPPGATSTPACYCRTHPQDSSVCSPPELMPILLAWPRVDFQGGFAMLGLGDIVVPALALSVALRFDYLQHKLQSGVNSTVTRRGDALESENKGSDVPSEADDASLLDVQRSRYSQSSRVDHTAAENGRGNGRRVSCLSRAANTANAALSLPPRKSGGIGYWFIGCLGYGAGLASALIAVNVFHVAQPALLYLVPCVLAPLLAMAAARQEFSSLWQGRAGTGDALAAPAAP
jgi:hypothetical protein